MTETNVLVLHAFRMVGGEAEEEEFFLLSTAVTGPGTHGARSHERRGSWSRTAVGGPVQELKNAREPHRIEFRFYVMKTHSTTIGKRNLPKPYLVSADRVVTRSGP